MDSDRAQLLKAYFLYFFSFPYRLFALWDSQTSCSNKLSEWKVIPAGWAGCQNKTWQTPWIDSFCSTRLSSATQFALSVSLQYLSIFIDVMDPIFPFFIYSPAAVYKTGFLINPASWVSNCHLPVMKINVARLIWMGDRYSSATCIYRLHETVKNICIFESTHSQCKLSSCLLWEMWPRM